MNYADGQEVLLGDQVSLGGGMTGRIVAVIDTGAYSKGYLIEEWSYLLRGALVVSPEAGLVHYPASDQDLVLISRG
jgi:hypothetical protein